VGEDCAAKLDQNLREQNDLDISHPKKTDQQNVDVRPDQSTRESDRR
jgi:hypothetical protein